MAATAIAATTKRDLHHTGPFRQDRVATRHLIEGQIEALIAVLDELDGDADSEEADPAEASLGWSLTYATGTNDEREEDRQCAC